MRKKKASKKPEKIRRERINWSTITHWGLNFILPLVLLTMVTLDLNVLAVLLVLVSKWRVFAVKPRHWLVNLRTNATDLIIKLSTLSFMMSAQSSLEAVGWTTWYVLWLIFFKPQSDTIPQGLQALAGTFLGLSAWFQRTNELPDFLQIIGVWLIVYSTARHFISSYEEPLARVYANAWALVMMQMAWVLHRWTLVYYIFSQAAVIMTIITYNAGSIYHIYKQEKLKPAMVRHYVYFTLAILAVIIVLSDWGGGI